MKSLSRLQKYGGFIASVLVLAVCVLTAANLIKYRSVAKEVIIQSKDLVDVLTKVVGSLALVAGAIASYYRFFRGRTFAARAELKLNVTVYDTNQEFKLHVINLEVSNVGPVPIWEPRPNIDVYLYGPKGRETFAIAKWWSPADDGKADEPTVSLIDTQESSQFHSSQNIRPEVWAVFYVAKVVSNRGDTWMRAVTVANREGSSHPSKHDKVSNRA